MCNNDDTGEGSLCYFLVCFSSAEFVAFLLASLYRPQDLYIIHCDLKAPSTLKAFVKTLSESFENIVVLQSQNYSWAGFSHVQITLEAMAVAISHTKTWTHFIALSEQHLPLKSPAQIATFLKGRKSMLALRPAKTMVGTEYCDMANRFGALYQELAGVGCFAVDIADRSALLETVQHGTNWFVLCRKHCAFMVQAFEDGKFAPFQSIVHAEETAIQTLIFSMMDEVDQQDVTIIALPHLTDNDSLIMSDKLFQESIDGEYLFIRKRTALLIDPVLKYVKNNHFDATIYGALQKSYISAPAFEDAEIIVNKYIKVIRRSLAACYPAAKITRIDPQQVGPTPRMHLVLNQPSLSSVRLDVRILSEDLINYKIIILRETHHQGEFAIPYIENGLLHSTIRCRVYGIFGYEDILPLNENDRGFVCFSVCKTIQDVVETAKRFLDIAQSIFLNGAPVEDPSAQLIVQENKTIGTSMPRSQRLNALAKLIGAKRYLEVGVCHGETFFEVDVPHKVAVDPLFRFDFESKANSQTIFHQLPSDEYFAQEPSVEPFDLIYLDGLHTFEQTARDLMNSLNVAHDKTVWLLDDTVPTNVFASLPNQLECWESRKKVGIDDWSWMGDVYKVVYFVNRLMPFFHYRTYEGHGQTVIWRSRTARTIPASHTFAADDVGKMSYEMMIRLLDEMRIASDSDILQAIRADLIEF